MWIVIVVFSICLHELAHAWVALKHGDDTAAKRGHLSLNPAIQMGVYSLFMLLLIGFAWGAVPVDESRMRSRSSGAWVAIAGPLANLGLVILFSFGASIIPLFSSDAASSLTHSFFFLGATLNAMLFLLNMLPVPMLDGWRVYGHFYPGMLALDPQRAQFITYVFFIMLIMAPRLFIGLWTGATTITIRLMEFWNTLFAPLLLSTSG